MKKKSGLADSPFFSPQVKKKAVSTPPPQDTVAGETPKKDVPPVPPIPPVPPEDQVHPEEEVRDVRGVRPVPPKKRKIKHHPFSIYEDQLDTLRKMKIEAMFKGIDRSIASMVRDALDYFIEENR